MNKKYKVLIIGAGPSGIATALNLLDLGMKDILVIEKYKFPRYKCCAGYITTKTKKEYERLGLSFNKINYSLILNFNIFYKTKLKQNIKNKFLFTNKYIDRVELDDNFYKLAKRKKINIIENCYIKSCDINNNYITLSNHKKVYYENLVFADGNNSYGNKYQKINKKNIAMQLTFPSNKKEEIQIHFGISKRGYGWVSSGKGFTNIGLTDLFNNKINYKDEFQKFLNKLNIESDMTTVRGTYTPIGIKKPIVNSNVYFVGDAVGDCDPLTLSGIKYALFTAKYLAKAIKEKNNQIYIKYINNLKIKFIFMKMLSKVFYFKLTMFFIFDIGCRFFGNIISFVFNHFFVNKK